MRYAIVIEPANDNFSAYVPDLPGWVATGATLKNRSKQFARPSNSISKGFAKRRARSSADEPSRLHRSRGVTTESRANEVGAEVQRGATPRRPPLGVRPD